jgi:seryl-tRNA synthetase
MVNKKLIEDLRLMNEADDSTFDVGGSGEPQVESTGEKQSSNPTPDYGEIQEHLEKATRGYDEVNQKMGQYSEKLTLLDKLQSVFKEDKPQAPKLDPDKIGYENLEESARELARNGQMTEKQLNEVLNRLDRVEQWESKKQFEEAYNNMTSYWTEEVFGDEQSLINALDAVGKTNPQLIVEYTKQTEGGRTPSVEYIAKLHNALQGYTLQTLLNPEGKTAQQIYKRIAQKQSLSKNSTMDGDGYRGGQESGSNSFLSVESTRF